MSETSTPHVAVGKDTVEELWLCNGDGKEIRDVKKKEMKVSLLKTQLTADLSIISLTL